MSVNLSACFPGSWFQRSETLHVTVWSSLVLNINQAVTVARHPEPAQQAEAVDESAEGDSPRRLSVPASEGHCGLLSTLPLPCSCCPCLPLFLYHATVRVKARVWG